MSIAGVNLLIEDHEIMNSNPSGMARFVHFILSRFTSCLDRLRYQSDS